MPPASPLSQSDRRTALAVARTIIPGTARIPAADEALVERADALARGMSVWLARIFMVVLRLLDWSAVLRTGRRLRSLSDERRETVLRFWDRFAPMRVVLTVVSLVYKVLHFDEPRVYEAMGGRSREAPKNIEQPRWLEQIHAAASWPQDEPIECDAVVVGTGAGGAVVGHELAERGHAVVFLEEGEHYRRDAFDGRSLDAHRRFFRPVVSIGNVLIPTYVGRLVGGSTAVNGATCFRTPPWVLDRWAEEMATDAFSPDRMGKLFQRVESFLEVQPACQPQVGPIAKVIARGCDKLGWSHFAINRNVVGCEGSGFCDFGCRTDARRSTNISYLPAALKNGAMLFTGARVDRVLVENGRAVGVEAVAAGGKRLRVRARSVVLAGGALPTPALLARQGLCNQSGQLGRNLTLHPSTGVTALMDEQIQGYLHIPQGYGCDHFLRQGELLTAAQPDASWAPMGFTFSGRRMMDALDDMSRMASLAILVPDSAQSGRIWLESGGRIVVRYSVTAEDCARLHSGMMHGIDLLAAAGAKRFYTAQMPARILELNDVERFRRSPPPAGEHGLLSYHPLGSCRMGKDPHASVVGLDHQTHEVRGLYVVDGSVVSGPLGVNSQLTIMAMAARAGGLIADNLS